MQLSANAIEKKNEEGIAYLATEGSFTILKSELAADNHQKKGALKGSVQTNTEHSNVRLVGRLYPEKINDRDFPEMEVQFGIVDNKVVWGQIGMTWNRWPYHWQDIPVSSLSFDPQTGTLSGTSVVPSKAVDTASLGGNSTLHVNGSMAGTTFVCTITQENPDENIKRHFNGGAPVHLEGGIRHKKPEHYAWMFTLDDKPWFTPIADFKEPQAGEHPRLLFRQKRPPCHSQTR